VTGGAFWCRQVAGAPDDCLKRITALSTGSGRRNGEIDVIGILKDSFALLFLNSLLFIKDTSEAFVTIVFTSKRTHQRLVFLHKFPLYTTFSNPWVTATHIA
jgi:hypothetical protein